MPTEHILALVAIVLALSFDFLNGFHDAANSIATVVSTRVLKPGWAVIWAAGFNFLAFFIFGLHVANTIATGLIDPSVITTQVVLAALIGAIVWNVLTWYLGLPSSSSHALIGGLLGAGIAKAGLAPLEWWGISKVLLAIVVSPLIGLVIGGLMMLIISRIFFRFSAPRLDVCFRKLQLVSSALISVSHGGNDAQKTMGIIAILLYSNGMIGDEFYVPLWVIVSCYLVLSIGTLMGGWRIIKTMGMRITKLKPVSGFCAETGSAITITIATILGIPVSTTHTITGSIVGVGAINGASAVRWGVARSIVWAWIFTIPASGLVAAAVMSLL